MTYFIKETMKIRTSIRHIGTIKIINTLDYLNTFNKKN